jgi:hypothetical protein
LIERKLRQECFLVREATQAARERGDFLVTVLRFNGVTARLDLAALGEYQGHEEYQLLLAMKSKMRPSETLAMVAFPAQIVTFKFEILRFAERSRRP